jgi:hypothetical protein
LRAVGQLFCQLLGLGVAEVDADLLHGNQDFRMDTQAGVCAGGDGFSFAAIGELIEEGCRHLRTAGVVNASEDNFDHDLSFGYFF